MRRSRVAKRISVLGREDPAAAVVGGAEVDWRGILDATEREIAATAYSPPPLGDRAWAGGKQKPAPRRKHGGRRAADDWTDADADVVFSTTAVDSESAIKSDIAESFSRAKEIIEEYRGVYMKSESTLSEFETFKADIDIRLEELEKENEELQIVLLSNAGDVGGSRSAGGHRGRRGLVGGEGQRREEKTKDDLRRELLNNAQDGDLQDDESGPSDGTAGRLPYIWAKVVRLLPLDRDLQLVRAALGGSVAAYFSVLRSLFISFLFLCIVSCFASILHLINIKQGSLWSQLASTNNILPEFMYFSTFSKKEGPFFVSLVLFNIFFIIIMGGIKLVQEDKLVKYFEASKGKIDHVHCDVILVGWDNSAADVNAKETGLDGAVSAKVAACRELLDKASNKNQKKDESWAGIKWLILVTKRLFGFLCYVCFQGTCYMLMFYLTVADLSVGSSSSDIYQKFRIMTPLFVISLYNNIFPYVIRLITKYEDWESSTELWILTGRMYASIMANIIIIGMAYGMLADPFLLAEEGASFVRRKLEIEFFPDTYGCRLNQFGDGLAVAVVMDLLVYVLFGLALHPMRKFSAWFLLYEYRPLEFSVASSMMSMLYLIGLIVLAVPFVPLLLVLSPIIIVLRFKFDVYMTMHYFIKPIYSIPSSQVRKTFSVYYFLTVSFIGICSVCFFLATRTFPKECAQQDRYVGLCADAVDESTSLCTLATSSQFYELYSDLSYCSAGYPACVCSAELLCGPFETEVAAVAPLRRYAAAVPTLSLIWYLLLDGSAGAWFFLLIAFVSLSFRTNSYRITKRGKDDKETQLGEHIESITKDIQKQNKIINRAKEL
jgi:hypothetical protein